MLQPGLASLSPTLLYFYPCAPSLASKSWLAFLMQSAFFLSNSSLHTCASQSRMFSLIFLPVFCSSQKDLHRYWSLSLGSFKAPIVSCISSFKEPTRLTKQNPWYFSNYPVHSENSIKTELISMLSYPQHMVLVSVFAVGCSNKQSRHYYSSLMPFKSLF